MRKIEMDQGPLCVIRAVEGLVMLRREPVFGASPKSSIPVASALGQKRTFAVQNGMSAVPSKADIRLG